MLEGMRVLVVEERPSGIEAAVRTLGGEAARSDATGAAAAARGADLVLIDADAAARDPALVARLRSGSGTGTRLLALGGAVEGTDAALADTAPDAFGAALGAALSVPPVLDPAPLADILAIAGAERFAAIGVQADRELEAGTAALVRAIGDGPAGAVATRAHALVGTAGAMGCAALAALAREIERSPEAARAEPRRTSERLVATTRTARAALASATRRIVATGAR
ncbi:MAG: hypothetical protein ACFBWO_16490 [Paracoccaceae bacterium]